ncbi:hypothetical protein Patl1_04013 [Pistacia atlantica]|uniref:Uncharacterized protein n=1 Tax=Pistacia atlantica TaxID=434234 RepID=A0ACC1BUA3_9ROSI|nr:hypothetical protein Patl1_04013 [Pistacia atlantica]
MLKLLTPQWLLSLCSKPESFARLEVPDSSPQKSWLIKVSEPIEDIPSPQSILFSPRNDSSKENHRVSRSFFKAGLSSDFDLSKKVYCDRTDRLANHFFAVDQESVVRIIDDTSLIDSSRITSPYVESAFLRYVNLDHDRQLPVEFKVFKLDHRDSMDGLRWEEKMEPIMSLPATAELAHEAIGGG